MDTNNTPNNNNNDNDKDKIEDVLEIMRKRNHRPSSLPKEQIINENNDKTVMEFNAAKANATSDKTQNPDNSDATRINFEPVKPAVKKSISTDISHTETPKAEKDASGAISLDDFNKTESTATKKKSKPVKVTFLGSGWFGIIKVVLYLCSVLLISWILASTVINVSNDVFAFVKNGKAEIDEADNVTIIIPENADTKDVAKILKKAGIIKYPTVFNLYAGFRISKRAYLTGEYISGEHTVNPLMNYDKLLDALSDYERDVYGTVRITIPEGYTVDEILELFEAKGVGKKENFQEALQSFGYEYNFAQDLTQDKLSSHRFDTDISYRLEGYLFPDTYDFYLGENPVSAIDKLLTNFNKKFEQEYYDRCKQLGMTVDEIITLASLIEKEGNNPADYYYISSVFHNRLNNPASFPYLDSDATVQYGLSERTGAYEVDTDTNHPYNTYKNRGLPPGPICNPGIQAIDAALYPEKTGYYYFYTKKNGETVFSKTYSEHQKYIYADKNS